MAWDESFVNPNIDAITMTYGYMRNYEDRVRRAVNTPDLQGPVRAVAGRDGAEHSGRLGSRRQERNGSRHCRSRTRAARGRQRQVGRPLEDGAHRPARLGEGWTKRISWDVRSRRSPTPTDDARGLTHLDAAPRTVRGARDLLSVALQYGNAFGQGMQAAALKPADFFGNDDVLYLMEDMATGEIRLSILWEWLHKRAPFTADDESGVKAGDRLTPDLFARLLVEEFGKLQRASNRDVYDDLEDDDAADRARDCGRRMCRDRVKLPWYIDLLNITLGNHDLDDRTRADPAVDRGLPRRRHAAHGEPGLSGRRHARGRRRPVVRAGGQPRFARL